MQAVLFYLASYGLTLILTISEGPFHIFSKMRKVTEKYGLFECPLCTSINIGFILSLYDWLLLNSTLTPFNLILGGGLLTVLLDSFACGAVCYLLFTVQSVLQKIIEM